MSLNAWATLAAFYGGLVWGTLWIPVRALDAAGVVGLWSVALFYGLAWLVSLPLVVRRRRFLFLGGWRQQLAGLMLGGAAAIYAAAFLFTEVASAVLLYYLAPAWGYILARLVLRDPITPVRWLAMLLALSGAAVMLGGEGWPPLPQGIGDWLALAAGLLFVIGSLMMLSWTRIAPLDYTLAFLFWATAAMVGLALAIEPAVPAPSALGAVLPWLLPFVVVVLLPGSYAILFAAAVLNPGTANIIFMSEIAVSVALASVLTDEPFGLRQVIGIVLVMAAASAEGLRDLSARPRRAGERP